MAPEDAPATKRDLAATERRLESLLAASEQRFERLLAANEERMVELIRDSQTEILKAFLPYQERNHIQFRELESN